MKTIMASSAGLILCLFCVGQLFATATYDSSLNATLIFSSPWSDYSSFPMSAAMGYGLHAENAGAIGPVVDVHKRSAHLSLFAKGWAGGLDVTNPTKSGRSGAGVSVTTNFTFNFSKPTNLTITAPKKDYTRTFIHSTSLFDEWNPKNETGEYADAQAWLMLSLDNAPGEMLDWSAGGSKTLPVPAGEHLISIHAIAGGYATAGYPYDPTQNYRPTVVAWGDGVYELNTPVTVGGTVSDADGDLLTYTWLEGTQILASGTIQTTQGGFISVPSLTIPWLSLGTHNITLRVSDSINQPVEDTVTVTIADNIAPTLAPVADKTLLWPAKHQMVDVVITANASDNSGLPLTLGTSVTSSEPENGLGDGDMAPDWTEPVINQQTGIIILQLRAERSANFSGRQYTITIAATDTSGNTSTAAVRVCVPLSVGK